MEQTFFSNLIYSPQPNLHAHLALKLVRNLTIKLWVHRFRPQRDNTTPKALSVSEILMIGAQICKKKKTRSHTHAHTQPGYELWMLATQTSSTCQLVLWESQGLHSLCLSFCTSIQGLSMFSATPASPLHLLFLALLSPASLTHFIPTIIPPFIRSLSLSLSAPVTEKQTLSLPLPSCSLQTPGSHFITEKRQRLAPRVHLCLV